MKVKQEVATVMFEVMSGKRRVRNIHKYKISKGTARYNPEFDRVMMFGSIIEKHKKFDVEVEKVLGRKHERT